jgi:hypothetical protein
LHGYNFIIPPKITSVYKFAFWSPVLVKSDVFEGAVSLSVVMWRRSELSIMQRSIWAVPEMACCTEGRLSPGY